MTAAEAQGTTFDGATPLLRAATPITPGPHSIYLSIFDQGDRVYDSAVLVDNLRFGRVADPATQCRPGAVVAGHDYVAIGDSTTTGHSVQSCTEDRIESPFGCIGEPPAPPYPERIADDGPSRFADLHRAGIWGYTIREAVEHAAAGQNGPGQPWDPQFLAASQAKELVTVSLGANDMQFSDVVHWLTQCVGKRFVTVIGDPCYDAATAKAASLVPDIEAMYDHLEEAHDRGAEVVVTLYYNPYNHTKRAGWGGVLSRNCATLHSISEIITGALNNQLERRANQRGFTVVDFRPSFAGHGAGSGDSYVFGSDCEAGGAATATDVDFRLGFPPVRVNRDNTMREIQKRFDPHPNAKGTAAQAAAILEVIG